MLLEALERERDLQAKHRRVHGKTYQDMNLVFCQPNGKPLHARNITQRNFRRVIKRAKVPHIRFHDLRHCCASMLLRQGVHPKVVGEQLGHSSIGVTLERYSHVVPGLMEHATTQLAERLISGSWR